MWCTKLAIVQCSAKHLIGALVTSCNYCLVSQGITEGGTFIWHFLVSTVIIPYISILFLRSYFGRWKWYVFAFRRFSLFHCSKELVQTSIVQKDAEPWKTWIPYAALFLVIKCAVFPLESSINLDSLRAASWTLCVIPLSKKAWSCLFCHRQCVLFDAWATALRSLLHDHNCRRWALSCWGRFWRKRMALESTTETSSDTLHFVPTFWQVHNCKPFQWRSARSQWSCSQRFHREVSSPLLILHVGPRIEWLRARRIGLPSFI